MKNAYTDNRSAMLLDTMRIAIQSENMIPAKGCVLVATSGGLDSMVLLHAMHRLAESDDFSIAVGHVDHGLRGTASMNDADFVSKSADHLGVPCYRRTLSDADLAAFRKQGREGAAREARRRALRELAVEAGADRIALAHTLDDRAETVLFNLTRGSGSRGFSAMPHISLEFIRPMLGVSRRSVLEYARRNTVEWREDASNTDIAFSRNRIRHRVLPELRHINPRVEEALCRSSERVGELSEASEALALDWVDERIHPLDDATIDMGLRGMTALPPPAQRLIIRASILRTRGSLLGITSAHVEAVRSLINSDSSHGTCSLPDLTIRHTGETLQFHKGVPDAIVFEAVDVDLGPTEIVPLGIRLHLEIVSAEEAGTEAKQSDASTEWIDADTIKMPLQVRTRRPGDRFTPLGLAKSMKLKNFLINERIPFFDRDSLPLLCDDNRIVWVVRTRISDTVKITSDTTRILRIRVEEMSC